MSNFDKLYNKRIDWKPMVAANKDIFLKEQLAKKQQSANLGSSLKQSGAQQMLMANNGIKTGTKN
eukprot:CAMPEP_0170563134 /NCGR_PEP_ID=MMETSP0211-20121228/64564_1 /TAXON_ID=311385 /ORGANISM="Pseudokeronopsis sp., Strain OXSARD2" /LENGTH=64 /DNA_ID=CAMNT_0010880949 /DNA_START=25 /DNA_END=219 /DNA_ORIENTATION=-